jgi:hypothetical protein
VKKVIQDKLDDIKKLAKASSEDHTLNEKKSSITVQDSLSKAIRNKKDAAIFLAELEAAFKMAQEEQ